MATLHLPEPASFPYGDHMYVRAPKPVFFPSEERLEDAVPESRRHLKARSVLFLLLDEAFAKSHGVGSDQFVYWDPRDPRKSLAPDAFVKLGGTDNTFDSWKVWERGAPDIAVEIVSASDHKPSAWAEKMERYEASGIGELVRFDPDDEEQPIRVWDRVGGELVERAAEDARLRFCNALQLWWVVGESEELGHHLRLARESDGQGLLPTPNEERVRLMDELAAERKARSLAEHERALAQHELRLAEEARVYADAERVRAEAERVRAEAERVRAEAERVRAEATAAEAERKLAAAQAEIARLLGQQGKGSA